MKIQATGYFSSREYTTRLDRERRELRDQFERSSARSSEQEGYCREKLQQVCGLTAGGVAVAAGGIGLNLLTSSAWAQGTGAALAVVGLVGAVVGCRAALGWNRHAQQASQRAISDHNIAQLFAR